MTQAEALSIMKTGANIFLTGEPGSGKTHTVNEYVAYLRDRGIEPAITASTGIAATHIGGMTIHSWSGIGIKKKLTGYDLDKLASTEYIAKRIKRTKILIIDEISMLAPETLVMVDAVCKEVRQSSEPFGGLQVVFVGDFFQLPPVVRRSEPAEAESEMTLFIDDEEPAIFAYDSPAWKKARPMVCYLTEQYRQDDDKFLAVLSAIRDNTFNESHLEHLVRRKAVEADILADVPKLFSRNMDVDRLNDNTLEAIDGAHRSFEMTSQGQEVMVAFLKKGCLSPDNLCLKIGASVMFTKNNLKEGFVNGTLGKVVEFGPITRNPIVKTRDGRRIEVSPMEWALEENGKVRAMISQLPLRLAWAITVHKSQGMSMDEAAMDLSDVFEYGQGYVALSRVRRLSGLHLLGWNAKAFQVHPAVLEADESFRKISEEAREAFGRFAPAELQKMHDNFIVACEGKKVKTKSKKKNPLGQTSPESKTAYFEKLAKMREKHPNAYRPWDKEQDENLTKAFLKNNKIADLVKTFGRQRGAIKARLVKLGLIEE